MSSFQGNSEILSEIYDFLSLRLSNSIIDIVLIVGAFGPVGLIKDYKFNE